MSLVVGYPIAAEARDLELYQLLCEVAASPRIARLASRLPRLERLRTVFEASEVSRRLIAVAVTSRSVMDVEAHAKAVLRVSKQVVGSLTPDVDKKTAKTDLTFREACNKIIHAQGVTLHDGRKGSRMPLRPLISLLGFKGEVCWEAEVDVLEFLNAAHDLP
jgi:hypothetical protein